MDFDRYQAQAKFTDQYSDPNQSLGIGFQNLFSVADSVRLTGLRFIDPDKDYCRLEHKHQIVEGLGDCLWYISTIASRLGVSLQDVANINLKKLGERWGEKTSDFHFFDADYPLHEQLPRNLTVEIKEVPTGGRVKVMVTATDRLQRQIGDRVNDNWHEDDGYRFHDVFHLAYVAYLGWSPVMRALLQRKRKSHSETDEIEDGARAVNLEEAVTALIYTEAKKYNFFEDVDKLDNALMVKIDGILRGLEVDCRTYDHWQGAILQGYKVFRKVRANKGGFVTMNMDNRKISFRKER